MYFDITLLTVICEVIFKMRHSYLCGYRGSEYNYDVSYLLTSPLCSYWNI